MEQLLEEGLSIPAGYDICLDIDCLLRMDQKTQMLTLSEGVKAGLIAPDEGRAKIGMGPVPGGKYPYLQQQNFSLEALAKRDTLPDPFVIDKPVTNPTPDGTPGKVGPASQEDPATTAAKAAEVIDVEFTIVRELMGPYIAPALPAKIEKAA
jgi:hypothetical protein